MRHQTPDAFTIVELLVVVTIIITLLAILLPSMSGAAESAQRAACGSNVHQLALASLSYAASHHANLPADASQNNGTWLWDLTRNVADALVDHSGSKVDVFYDPAVPHQNVETHWDFNADYRVTGYWFTFKRVNGAMSTIPDFLSDHPWVSRLTQSAPPGQQLVLLADATVSSNFQFAEVMGGSSIPHRTSHLDFETEMPEGGNIGMLDGSVQWRPFDDMRMQLPNPQQWF